MSEAEAHADDHPDFLAHHFDSPMQQFEAGKLGMWLFLATEMLLFGGLFCAYAVWRGNHPELFKYGSQYLDTTMGAVNTGVLILSSLTMAWAVTAAQQNKQRLLVLMLCLTLSGAIGFLVIKYFEYTHKFHEGWYPGMMFYEQPEHSKTWDDRMPVAGVLGLTSAQANEPPTRQELSIPEALAVELPTTGQATKGTSEFNIGVLELEETKQGRQPAKGVEGSAGHDDHAAHGGHVAHPLQDPERPKNAHMFFNIYFMMTGLHGIHVLAGCVVIIWLLVKSLRRRFHSKYFTPVDLGGLYWHVVDLIWIFLFPLFYLI